MDRPVLSVEKLNISFADFHAVKDINIQLQQGKTLAVVGESGSGKSLTALAVMGLLPKQANINGTVQLYVANKQHNLLTATVTDWQQLRGNRLGMVFQEPMSSLNPVMKIGKQLAEVILTHKQVDKQTAKQQAIEWLRKVQLPHPEKIYSRYPHQLSGGQKQRVMIAMAMCNQPALLIADEPTTALDVTVQKEVIALMQQLQQILTEHSNLK